MQTKASLEIDTEIKERACINKFSAVKLSCMLGRNIIEDNSPNANFLKAKTL